MLLSAEGKVQSGEILEIVLCTGIARAIDAETSVEVIHFDRARLDVLSQGKVQSAAELHGEALLLLLSEWVPGIVL